MRGRLGRPHLLAEARVYLSGPMDFVGNRANEKREGWRHRVGAFLRELGVTVFDPWEKPEIRGLHEYGLEEEKTTDARGSWTYEKGRRGALARSRCADGFWPSMHTDLRMVDTSDFVIAYCPTNVYSVGTPHEIILSRQQRKPVLFVSPYVDFPALRDLRQHLQGDEEGLELLERLVGEVPIKANANAAPSLWYMPLVGGEHFFDGFGFKPYRRVFREWTDIRLDAEERRRRPVKPLLPFLQALNRRLPQKWDRGRERFVPNDDWLLWKLSRQKRGAAVTGARGTRQS
jgi:hypothetical protein